MVGASNFIPWTLWINQILKCQGYDTKKTIFYQDNESAVKLERNGLKSCGDRSRHIYIRYFFIKDVLEREDIYLEHCKTERMIADILTKPLQGGLFRLMRDIIVCISPFPAEERVNKSRNMTKHINCKNATGARTDQNVQSHKSTYVDIVRSGSHK